MFDVYKEEKFGTAFSYMLGGGIGLLSFVIIMALVTWLLAKAGVPRLPKLGKCRCGPPGLKK